MKKTLRLALLTAVISAFSVGGVKAQNTLVNYPTSTDGLVIGKGATVGEVAIHENDTKNKITGILLDGNYISSKKCVPSEMITIKPAGGLKKGDKITVAAVYNNSSLKTAEYAITDFVVNNGKVNELFKATANNKSSDGIIINGRFSKLDPKDATYTLTADYDSLGIGKTGSSTKFYVTKLVVTREGVETPVFTIDNSSIGTNETAQITVNGRKDLDGITLSNIKYSTDGVVEVSETGLVTPKGVGSTTVTFTSAAVANKYEAGTGEVSVTVTKPLVAKPTFDPASGTVFTTAEQVVNIATKTPNATVYYSTDKSTWTAGEAGTSEASLTLTDGATVYAYATADEMTASDTVSAVYQKDKGIATLTNFGGTKKAPTFTVDPSNADIALSLDGSEINAPEIKFRWGSNKFTLSSKNKTIIGIALTLREEAAGYGDTISVSTGEYNTAAALWTGSAKSVTFTNATTNSNGNLYISKIVVYYEGSEVPVPVPTETATIGAAGYATYVTKGDVDFSGETALKAFAAKFDETAQTIKLTAVNAAPANTPLVLKGAAGDYTLTAAKEAPAAVSNNDLQAASAAVTADGSQWILAKLNGGVGFAKCTPNTTIAAGKAYLVILATATAKSFIGFDDDTTNGIASVISEEASMKNARVYNLAGQQVTKAYKGVVIVNGKKYIQK